MFHFFLSISGRKLGNQFFCQIERGGSNDGKAECGSVRLRPPHIRGFIRFLRDDDGAVSYTHLTLPTKLEV